MFRTCQRGAALLVSLIMLVILTLFVVSAISMSSMNLKIVGNAQSQRTLENNAQQAIEQVLSSGAAFTFTPSGQTVTVNDTDVAVYAPTCAKSVVAPGYDLTQGPVPDDNHWEVVANVEDDATGGKVTVKQAIRIRTPPENCPS
jgi:type II secretory pathway pseudopilin PulG